MKSIEIKTTQNVVLEYELADVKDRIFAFLLDQVILFFGLLILLSILISGFGLEGLSPQILTLFIFGVYIFYSLGMELLNHGQTIGKMALHIRVISTTGNRAAFSDYAARWAFRLIDIFFSLGGIASILVASSVKAQRIGDVVGNTAVIKTVSQNRLRLQDLMSIQTQESYTPTFIQAKYLSEEDVLLIKSALDRYRLFPNDAHEEALELLRKRIIDVLKIEDGGHVNARHFLQAVLKDYVVLTR